MKLRKLLAKRLMEIKGDSSQAAFSKRVGVGQATLNRLLQGEQNLSIDLLDKICQRLKIDVFTLLKGK